MPTIWTLLRATAVVAGGSAALLAGGIAHADPAPPVPVPNMGQQLASVAANAPQMLQSLATALGAKPPAPATPPPLASLQVPQLPPTAATPGTASNLPGAASRVSGPSSLVPGTNPLLPGTSPLLPGTTTTAPGASPSTTGPGQLLPQAQLNLPQSPLLPVPLPQQVSLPGDLASLAPGGVPVPHGIQPGTTGVAAPGAGTAAPSNPLLIPLSALP